MRTSKLSTLLVSALAVLALAATGCKKKSETSTPQACTLAPLDGACTADGDCCSGNCFVASGQTSGTCVSATCAANGGSCAVRSDCCEASCNQTTHLCGPPGSCGFADGASCGQSDQCCSGICAGPSGAKTCVPQGCFANTFQCGRNSDCCTGFCDAGACATPQGGGGCVDDKQACSANTQCCSKFCDAGRCANSAGTCAFEGEFCENDVECCGLVCLNAGTAGATCSPGLCAQANQPCSPGNNLCCSGTCGVGNVCVPPPSGTTGQTCATEREACAYAADCCSKNCQGATNGLKNGVCMPVASCNAFGDLCYRGEDCCSGLCSATGGAAGRCDDAPGGCGQDGYPCSADSGCCTKRCVDLGTGAKACQPSGGCRLNGNYCDTTASCCNVNYLVASSQWIECDPVEHVCDNGGSCNPPGDICGLNAAASQNCCFGKKDVCKYDMNGIPRCFGGCPTNDCSQGNCPTGWDGNNPQCCIQPGDICQFRDQCCGLAPCVPDAQGVLRCSQPATQCLPSGATCSTAPPPTGGYTPIQGECCDGTLCHWAGAEVGWACATQQPPPTCVNPDDACSTSQGATPCCVGACLDRDPTAGTNYRCTSCLPNGTQCSSGSQCCSTLCEGGLCRPPCQAAGGTCTVNQDCCTGTTCEIAPGDTSGVCGTGGGGGPTCADTGQTCAASTDCCKYVAAGGGDTCQGGVCTAPVQCRETAQACTAAGQAECCTGLRCYTLDTFENRIDCSAGAACFCDVPSCANLTQACSTLVPCCTGICSPTDGSGTCTSTNPADCVCKPIG